MARIIQEAGVQKIGRPSCQIAGAPKLHHNFEEYKSADVVIRMMYPLHLKGVKGPALAGGKLRNKVKEGKYGTQGECKMALST